MSDTYTETTKTGWTTRIGESLKGIVLGLVLVVASCIGLFWNEGRAVQTAKSLAEGESLVVDIDPGRIDPANEGKLIHVTGTMKAGTAPNDTEFGVSADGLKLVRTVEMYQWQEEQKTETRKNVGGRIRISPSMGREGITRKTRSRSASSPRVRGKSVTW